MTCKLTVTVKSPPQPAPATARANNIKYIVGAIAQRKVPSVVNVSITLQQKSLRKDLLRKNVKASIITPFLPITWARRP